MDDVLPKITTKLSLQIENGRRRAMLCDLANTNSAIFVNQKGDVSLRMKDVTNGQPIAGDTVWATRRSGKYMSRQLFEDKDLHDLSDLTPQSAPQQNQRRNRREDQQDYSDISNHQDDAIVNHLLSLLVLFFKAGNVGQSFAVMRIKIDPKLVTC